MRNYIIRDDIITINKYTNKLSLVNVSQLQRINNYSIIKITNDNITAYYSIHRFRLLIKTILSCQSMINHET